MSCGVGTRLDLVLLWLWHRPAAAALIKPLAWEPPYAMGTALKQTNKNKQTNKKKHIHFDLLYVTYIRGSLNDTKIMVPK